jgi:hypothetical protein
MLIGWVPAGSTSYWPIAERGRDEKIVQPPPPLLHYTVEVSFWRIWLAQAELSLTYTPLPGVIYDLNGCFKRPQELGRNTATSTNFEW